jgi:AraC-like DNA-binding protein
MDNRIEAALRMIGCDIRNTPGPRQMANKVGLSVSRFYGLFRQETGTAPASYIRKLRFEKARELLTNSNFSIKEITYLVGIHDVSHFVRDFRKAYGMAPRAFRRGHACSSPGSIGHGALFSRP